MSSGKTCEPIGLAVFVAKAQIDFWNRCYDVLEKYGASEPGRARFVAAMSEERPLPGGWHFLGTDNTMWWLYPRSLTFGAKSTPLQRQCASELGEIGRELLRESA